jgi:hypothetical protein
LCHSWHFVQCAGIRFTMLVLKCQNIEYGILKNSSAQKTVTFFFRLKLCYDRCNTMDNQYIIQSTPAVFSFKSWTTDVVITVEKVRAPNAGRCSGAPNMYWPRIRWLNHAMKRGVDCNERCLYAALIIYCVDCSVAESRLRHIEAQTIITIWSTYLYGEKRVKFGTISFDFPPSAESRRKTNQKLSGEIKILCSADNIIYQLIIDLISW